MCGVLDPWLLQSFLPMSRIPPSSSWYLTVDLHLFLSLARWSDEVMTTRLGTYLWVQQNRVRHRYVDLSLLNTAAISPTARNHWPGAHHSPFCYVSLPFLTSLSQSSKVTSLTLLWWLLSFCFSIAPPAIHWPHGNIPVCPTSFLGLFQQLCIIL